MTVPAYVDVSHFRAPYKNAYFSGYGAVQTPSLKDIVVTSPDGYRRVIPSFQVTLLDNILGEYSIVQKGNLGHMALFTPEQIAAAAKDPKYAAVLRSMSAGAWARGQAEQGRLVFMAELTLYALLTNGLKGPGIPDYMGFFDADDPKAASAKVPNGAILVAGGGTGGEVVTDKGFLASIGPVGVVVGVVAIGGLGYLLMNRQTEPEWRKGTRALKRSREKILKREREAGIHDASAVNWV
jgi:hypothetical protein